MTTQENTLTLGPRETGKIGVSHCGVTRDGLIAVVGDQSDIADDASVTFERVGITANRKADVYTFSKI